MPIDVKAKIAEATASLSAAVAQADAATAPLRKQREDLGKQIAQLQKQAADLDAQISETEGPEVRRARETLSAITAPPQLAQRNLPPHIEAMRKARGLPPLQ